MTGWVVTGDTTGAMLGMVGITGEIVVCGKGAAVTGTGAMLGVDGTTGATGIIGVLGNGIIIGTGAVLPITIVKTSFCSHSSSLFVVLAAAKAVSMY